MVRHNNQLPHNLPQLQNLIKRDSESYKDDVSTTNISFKKHSIILKNKKPLIICRYSFYCNTKIFNRRWNYFVCLPTNMTNIWQNLSCS